MQIEFAKVFEGLPLAEACDFSFPSGIIAQEKIDGWRGMLDCDTGRITGRNGSQIGEVDGSLPAGCLIDGEWKGGQFHAFDLVRLGGQSIAGEPIEFRLGQLDKLTGNFARVEYSFDAQSLARKVNFSGGEGIVIKRLGTAYNRGQWTKCKRQLTIDAVILSVDQFAMTAEVAIGGNSVGRVFGFSRNEIESAWAGRMVEVAAMELTANGKLRHGRFLRFRDDKATR